ncbi:predicted protein, partial [Nematostella vectensis]
SLNNATSPIVNGVHSSPTGPASPTGLGNTANQLPPACGARQLSKLKRFLTTLMQFGSDISPEIGERVRGLVMNLVNSTISIEEFHGQLQEATNFPLRPFVIPFLKANLPLLQRELLQCAQMAKQTPQQYLHQHEQILHEREEPPMDPEELAPMEVNENGKRKAPSEGLRPKENGADLSMMMGDLGKPSPKRPCLSSSEYYHLSRITVCTQLCFFIPSISFCLHSALFRYFATIHLSRNGIIVKCTVIRYRPEILQVGGVQKSSVFLKSLVHSPLTHHYILTFFFHEAIIDDWRHVDTMLQCIIGMVDKTKRAVSVLQQRCQQDREELLTWARKSADETETEIKRRVGDLVGKSMKQTEERVNEVKRRAEEAVSEVKRQAVVELQKAVRAAEEKANEAVAGAHAKMEKAVLEARRQAIEETNAQQNVQTDSNESCWNCGRKATETCSGCNVARYCGSFCQHKDWENHHHICGQQSNTANEDNASANGSAPSPKASSTRSNSPATSRHSA